MSFAIQGLVYSFKKNRDYGANLVADLSTQQMVMQPQLELPAPVNHPAWILSHLNVYLPVLGHLISGEQFPDPKGHRHGMNSKPESESSMYDLKEEMVTKFVAGHDRVIQLLESADDSIFARPVTLARWQSLMPNLGIALPYLMLYHENSHLGQLSAWRRVMGLPSV
jgi:hypothetical protein